jgi:hypothetical protein
LVVVSNISFGKLGMLSKGAGPLPSAQWLKSLLQRFGGKGEGARERERAEFSIAIWHAAVKEV